MSVLLIFIDGLGLGPADPTVNPLSSPELCWFRLYSQDGPAQHCCGSLCASLVPTDPTLGIPGLPQSATGQTTIMTGVNAAEALGLHLNGFCTPTLTGILAQHSLFVKAQKLGKSATFANAYSPVFFEGKVRHLSCTTRAIETAGLRFRNFDDLLQGRAVYQEFTRRILRERGFNLPLIEPEEAGRHLAEIAHQHDFTMYEYFQTDLAGHAQDMERAQGIVRQLEEFLSSLLNHMDWSRDTVILTSDHGNIENLSIKTHTYNLVPTLVWGKKREEAAGKIRSLIDIAPAVMELLEKA